MVISQTMTMLSLYYATNTTMLQKFTQQRQELNYGRIGPSLLWLKFSS